jgi:hypothetical protein
MSQREPISRRKEMLDLLAALYFTRMMQKPDRMRITVPELQKTLQVVQYKCWYYETAYEAGTEDVPRNITVDDLPEDARKGKFILEKSLSE